MERFFSLHLKSGGEVSSLDKFSYLIERQILRGSEWIVCTYRVNQFASRVTNDILNKYKKHSLVEVVTFNQKTNAKHFSFRSKNLMVGLDRYF